MLPLVPPHARIDWTKPITNGLKIALHPAMPVNAANNAPGTVVASTYEGYGFCQRSTLGFNFDYDMNGRDFTLFSWFYVDVKPSTSTTLRINGIVNYAASNNQGAMLYLAGSAASLTPSFLKYHGATTTNINTTAIAEGFHTMAGTFQRTYGMRLFVNGDYKSQNVATLTEPYSIQASVDYNLGFGGNGSTLYSLVSYKWDRILTDTEIKLLHFNPLQIWEWEGR